MGELAEISVNLNRALTAVENAITEFGYSDSQGRLKWTPTESLSEKTFSCAISTVEQLRALLQPALHSETVHVAHNTGAPHRTVLEYTAGNGNTYHVVIIRDTILDTGASRTCMINYRLAYYLAVALGNSHTPPFAYNIFDSSMALYLNCLTQEPQPRNCNGITNEFPIQRGDIPFKGHVMTIICDGRIQSGRISLHWLKTCVDFFWKKIGETRNFLWQSVRSHGGLTFERRSLLQSEIEKIPMPPDKTVTIQDALVKYEDIKKTMLAYLQTTAGRHYFWELRTQLPFTCKSLTGPEQQDGSPKDEIVECNYLGFTTRRVLTAGSKHPTNDVTRK